MKIKKKVQTFPDSLLRLHQSVWRDRDNEDWTGHYVSVRSSRMQNAELVPIFLKEYRARPQVWPQGSTGMM